VEHGAHILILYYPSRELTNQSGFKRAPCRLDQAGSNPLQEHLCTQHAKLGCRLPPLERKRGKWGALISPITLAAVNVSGCCGRCPQKQLQFRAVGNIFVVPAGALLVPVSDRLYWPV
jgi:hypothetical protein